ncbi:2-amino-4-hydroxy-6-hydroxymethyldihydropteridine diphosphokinase [Chryseobacterium sp.]|uniref:2-amino-4-hydroxy-6- hydroxymethyldihydropteridine diphosphokinase n=1 Tax=Chryseobacterium sp. TaxID=1871047 RepID=UPI00388F1824
MSQHEVVLLLGSNIGDQKKNIDEALERLNEAGKISQHTDYLYTEPIEFVSCNIFCNIAAVIYTQLSPIQLLNFIKKTEVEMGRNQDSTVTLGYTDRIIDIDIVKYDYLNFRSKRLVVPHEKHLFCREFSKSLLRELKLNT